MHTDQFASFAAFFTSFCVARLMLISLEQLMEFLLDMSMSPSPLFLPAMYPLNTAAQSTWVWLCDGPSNYRLPNRAQPAKYHISPV
jgi:hypothetical protein